MDYITEYNQTIKLKSSASSFQFECATCQNMRSIIAQIPSADDTKLHIKTQLLPINVPFLIGLDMFT